MTVEDIMQPEVYCASVDMTLEDLYQELQAQEISGAPVLDANDYLVGVVSNTDVAKHVGDGNTDLGQSLSDIMTPCIHQVAMDSSLEEVISMMLDEDIHRVIVTRRGRVLGIVTSSDLLRAFRRVLSSS